MTNDNLADLGKIFPDYAAASAQKLAQDVAMRNLQQHLEPLREWAQHDPFTRASPALIRAVEKVEKADKLASVGDALF